MSWDGIFYDKYKIAHTDGTPLKGKRYFVLRLDSDDLVEAARVRAAMLTYEKKPRNCDIGTAEEQEERFSSFCNANETLCARCKVNKISNASCFAIWAQMPYEKGDNDGSK